MHAYISKRKGTSIHQTQKIVIIVSPTTQNKVDLCVSLHILSRTLILFSSQQSNTKLHKNKVDQTTWTFLSIYSFWKENSKIALFVEYLNIEPLQDKEHLYFCEKTQEPMWFCIWMCYTIWCNNQDMVSREHEFQSSSR